MSGSRLRVVLSVLALAAVIVTSASLSLTRAGGPGAGGAASWVPWDHWGIELFLVGRQSTPTADEFTFELRLRRGTESATISLGYPRYRGPGLRWADAVMGGEVPRDRVLRLGREEHRTLIVYVPAGAEELRIPLDGEPVAVDLTEARGRHAGDAPEEPVVAAAVPHPPRPAPGHPARLTTDVRWIGVAPFEDGAIDAGESGELLVDVRNDGERTTWNVKIRITVSATTGLRFPAEVSVSRIDPGETATAIIPFEADEGVVDGVLRMTIETLEEFGHDAAPVAFEIATRAAPVPRLELLDDFVVEVASGGAVGVQPVPRDVIVTVRLRVRNAGHGVAANVVADIVPGEGVFRAADGPVGFEVGDLEPGEVGEIAYRCYANRRAEALDLRVVLFADRSRSRPVSHEVGIPLEGSGDTRVVRIRAAPREDVALAPAPAPLVSNIDRALPIRGLERPNALAVVLGVERYANAPPASWSADDARTAGRYFERVLGVPAHRIQLLVDAEVTLAQFHRIFGVGGWLDRRMRHDSEVFVFFAGHGIAASGARSPFLVPAEGDTNYVEQTGFELGLLLQRVASLGASQATVFIDACFSGITREGSALVASARPMVLVPVRDHVPGVSVFAASSGTQVAGTLESEGHGLFSYFLFRGLGGDADADDDHRVTTGELRAYLEQAVPAAAELVDREQDPSVHLDSSDAVLVQW